MTYPLSERDAPGRKLAVPALPEAFHIPEQMLAHGQGHTETSGNGASVYFQLPSCAGALFPTASTDLGEKWSPILSSAASWRDLATWPAHSFMSLRAGCPRIAPK